MNYTNQSNSVSGVNPSSSVCTETGKISLYWLDVLFVVKLVLWREIKILFNVCYSVSESRYQELREQFFPTARLSSYRRIPTDSAHRQGGRVGVLKSNISRTSRNHRLLSSVQSQRNSLSIQTVSQPYCHTGKWIVFRLRVGRLWNDAFTGEAILLFFWF